MKILFVLEYYFPNIGGVETLFKNLCESLAASGHEIRVITTRFDPSLPTKESLNGVEIHRINVFNRYLFTLFAFFKILRHLRGVECIHTTSYNAGVPAILSGMIFRKKVLITFHEVWGKLWFELPFMSKLGKWGHYLYEQLLLRMPFYRFIAVSQSTKKRLQENGVPEEKVELIYNGIDYSDFTETWVPPAKPPFRMLYFGRLGMSKGLDLIIPAFEQFRKENPDALLILVIPKIPKPLYNKVRKLISDHQLENDLEMFHNLTFNELKEKISRVHGVLIPSYSEGFCFAAAEAAAIGVPIIHSDRAALSEVVSGKQITMPAFSVEGLFQAMQMLKNGQIEETPLRKFRLEDNLRGYLNLYERV